MNEDLRTDNCIFLVLGKVLLQITHVNISKPDGFRIFGIREKVSVLSVPITYESVQSFFQHSVCLLKSSNISLHYLSQRKKAKNTGMTKLVSQSDNYDCLE